MWAEPFQDKYGRSAPASGALVLGSRMIRRWAGQAVYSPWSRFSGKTHRHERNLASVDEALDCPTQDDLVFLQSSTMHQPWK